MDSTGDSTERYIISRVRAILKQYEGMISLVGLTMFIHFYTVDIRSVYHELLKQFVAFYKNIANRS